MKTYLLAGVMSLISTVQCQKMLEWPESTSGVTYKLAIPDASAAPFDIVLSIIAPKSAGWVGFASGGCMLRSPLLIAWPNGDGAVVSSRWARSVSSYRQCHAKTAKRYL